MIMVEIEGVIRVKAETKHDNCGGEKGEESRMGRGEREWKS